MCTICIEDHDTEQCPSFPGLKAVFKEAEEVTKLVYLMNQRRQWQAKPTSMSQDALKFFPSSQFNQHQNLGAAWQGQSLYLNWQSPPFLMTSWPTQSFLGNGWPNSPFTLVWQVNRYQSQWPTSTSQNLNWSTNWQRPLGISNVPLGTGPQPQPALSAPYTLQ